MGIARHGAHHKAQCAQVLFYAAAQLLAVLQRAGRVEHHARCAFHRQKAARNFGQKFAQVSGEAGDTLRFVGIGLVVGQGVGIVFDGAAAAGRVHDDGFHTAVGA